MNDSISSTLTLPKPQKGIVQTDSTNNTRFRVGALEPSWILEGNPVVRALGLTKSGDDLFSSGLWDCTAGKFKYIFPCDEIVHILEGEVIVEEDGATHVLRPGDVAFFRKGHTTYWTVPHYVKKFAIYRSAPASLLSKLVSRAKKLVSVGLKCGMGSVPVLQSEEILFGLQVGAALGF